MSLNILNCPFSLDELLLLTNLLTNKVRVIDRQIYLNQTRLLQQVSGAKYALWYDVAQA